jgi:hypothetical protein
MIRRLLASRKKKRKEANYAAIKPIYDRGGMSLPAEHLTCHQPSEPERVDKIKVAAEERRRQRNERRLAHANRVSR